MDRATPIYTEGAVTPHPPHMEVVVHDIVSEPGEPRRHELCTSLLKDMIGCEIVSANVPLPHVDELLIVHSTIYLNTE